MSDLYGNLPFQCSLQWIAVIESLAVQYLLNFTITPLPYIPLAVTALLVLVLILAQAAYYYTDLMRPKGDGPEPPDAPQN